MPEENDWLKNFPEDSLVIKAYYYTQEKHKNTLRESGESYFNHVFRVAKLVYDWKLNEASIAAAFLHDVIEDENDKLENIEKEFNQEIAFLVDSLTKIKNIKYKNKIIFTQNEKEIKKIESENFRKLLISFCKDIRVLIIKLADRYDNLKTLYALPDYRQRKYAIETLDIYAPLAYRLGMQKLSSELEEMAFPYAYPDKYEWLIKNIKEAYEEREKYIEKIKPLILELLEKNNIHPIEIQARAKKYYSLYKKLLNLNMDINSVYDLVAVRIIVETIEQCYQTLGIIHQNFPPLPNRFKDYIARPKINGYQSLHTTVFCFENKITEFQIRTLKMHQEAEFGIAAHWAYSEAKIEKEKSYKTWYQKFKPNEFEWIKQLQAWQESFKNSKNFLKEITQEFFVDQIYVLTPKNDIISLPINSTPIDFAYKIHSEIGNQCVNAKVNGQIVPLNYKLQSGDIIEIITQKNKKPSLQWLEFVKTPSAREKILKALKEKNKKLKENSKKLKLIEFKIKVFDRPGYLKELTNIFSQSKINILFLNSQTNKKNFVSNIILKIEEIPENKLTKIIEKIKSLKDTKEVNFRKLSN